MKMITKCTIEVRLPTFLSHGPRKCIYKHYARLADFVTYFEDDDHSLQMVLVLFNRCFRKGYISLCRVCEQVR